MTINASNLKPSKQMQSTTKEDFKINFLKVKRETMRDQDLKSSSSHTRCTEVTTDKMTQDSVPIEHNSQETAYSSLLHWHKCSHVSTSGSQLKCNHFKQICVPAYL